MVIVLLGMAAGWVGGSAGSRTEINDLKSEVASLRGTSSRESAESADSVEELEDENGNLADEVDDLEARIEELEAELSLVTEERDDLQGRLDVATATTAPPPGPKTSFGDGVWIVGSDVAPGQYRATGPFPDGLCYWALLSDPTGADIIENNIVETGQALTALTSGQYFESSGCGQWEIVG
jgi:hypothetical protein